MDGFLIDSDNDPNLYKDDTKSGFVSNKKDRAINAAGKATALASRQVAQAVKERDLTKREEELKMKTMESMMGAMMAKQQADQQVGGLLDMAKQLSFQQAVIDGKMQAQQAPPLPLDPMAGGLPAMPIDMGGMPPLPMGGDTPMVPEQGVPSPGPIAIDPSMAPPMM